MMLQMLYYIWTAFALPSFRKPGSNIYVLRTNSVPKAITQPNANTTPTSYAHAKYTNGSTCATQK